MDTKIALERFELSKMVKSPHILIIGKRGAGKTILVENIIKYLMMTQETSPNISIVSPTERMDHHYECKFPTANVKNDPDENFCKKILIDASQNIEKGNKKNEIFVIDDYAPVKKSKQNESLKEILMNGRHYCISLVVTMQTGHSENM